MTTSSCPRCGGRKVLVATVCRSCYQSAQAQGIVSTRKLQEWAHPKPAIKISGSCSIYVEGLDFQCPFCKVTVRSWQRHACHIPPPQPALEGRG